MKIRIQKYLPLILLPTLLLFLVCFIFVAIENQWSKGIANLVIVLMFAVILFSVEAVFPLGKQRGLTKKNGLRDLKYISLSAITVASFQVLTGSLVIAIPKEYLVSRSETSLLLSVPAVLLLYDFINYWYHRICHSNQGMIGRFLWKVHVTHHLPETVYTSNMFIVHPIDFFVEASLLTFSIFTFRASQDAAFVAVVVSSVVSLISHSDFDFRAGFLNYFLIGAETHRFHHSAASEQSGNFGYISPIWDLAFGTFIYQPGRSPDRTGVFHPEKYPTSHEVLKLLKLPFN